MKVVFYTRDGLGGTLSRTGADKMKTAVQLVRRGATMLGEPCPKCGGIQVRFHGKIYCTSHEDLSDLLTSETLSAETVNAELREVLLSKMTEASAALKSEKDVMKQDQLATLIAKYLELLQKASQKPQRP